MFCSSSRFRFGVRVIYSTAVFIKNCLWNRDAYWNSYLFEVRTVSYGPSFPLRFMAQARSARAINRREQKQSIC